MYFESFGPGATGMRSNQIDLKIFNIFVIYSDISETSKACVYAIHNGICGRNFVLKVLEAAVYGSPAIV